MGIKQMIENEGVFMRDESQDAPKPSHFHAIPNTGISEKGEANHSPAEALTPPTHSTEHNTHLLTAHNIKLHTGISEKGEANRSPAEALKDPLRLRYFKGYIDEACK